MKNPRADILPMLKSMRYFIPYSQFRVMEQVARTSNEMDDAIQRLHSTIATMPVTYGQDGKGDDAVAFLHYFSGGADWYITEKDRGDDNPVNLQQQAFGLCCISDPELGYVSLHELAPHPSVNVDLHWTPKTVRECRREWLAKMGG